MSLDIVDQLEADCVPPPICKQAAKIILEMRSCISERHLDFKHFHVNAHDGTDRCAKCKGDLRDPIHRRVQGPMPASFA